MRTAKDLAQASLKLVREGDRDGWLALFAEDGVVQDPVGVSPLDPTGQGHRGKAAITKFYDTVISKNSSVKGEITEAILCGDECACTVAFQMSGPDGKPRVLRAINVYKATKDGKLASLRSFWDISSYPVA